MPDDTIPGQAVGAASGRFLLRLPPKLHDRLRRAAAGAGLSLNDYCCRRLTVEGSGVALVVGAAETVAKAVGLYGDQLVGVAVFGSWARGEAASDSDLDLLVVLDEHLPITRRLYDPWDQQPLFWEGLRVEPVFSHLPETGTPVSAVWAETAVDGIVLYERGLTLSRVLMGIRRAIAAGLQVRKSAGGSVYWVAEDATS